MNKAINSFHPNGKVKYACVLDASGKPVGTLTHWDENGRLIQEISAQDCDVVFVKKRLPMEEFDAKIQALEERVAELELRLHISPKLEPEQTRARFLELISLIDTRSLQRVFSYFTDETIAGSMLDLAEETKQRMLSCLSRTRRKEILEMVEILQNSSNRVTVVVDDSDGLRLKHVEVGLVDYALPYKGRILEKISWLERRGEIVCARSGGHEIYV